ncbi:INGR1 protein, partial [Donacobius atricapilla]|nr:INGR1 protein [Donacobius atricapilla]
VFHFFQTEELYEDNCTMHKCSLKIPVPTESSTYCVSAEGIFENLMVGTPSEESCAPPVPLEQPLSTHGIIILCGVIGILTVIPTIYCGCKKLRKSNIQLPKSLVIVMRNLNTGALLGPRSERKYVSVISFPSCHSELPVNGEVTLLGMEPEQTVSPVNSCDTESSVPSPEAPAKVEKVPVQESTEEVSFDADEQNCVVKESYFISDSSQMDICSKSSGSEISTTETQQTVIPSTCFKFSGYDKPHVPLDVLMIDVGEEQPVNAYRPTE